MWTIPALIAVFVRTPPRTFLNDLMKVDIALSTDNRKHPKRLLWLMKRGKVARLNLLAMMEWLDVAGSRLQFAILKSYFQRLQAPLIFLGCSDRNTEPLPISRTPGKECTALDSRCRASMMSHFNCTGLLATNLAPPNWRGVEFQLQSEEL